MNGWNERETGVERTGQYNRSRWIARYMAARLAGATLSAIARFTIVHRAILTGLLTARLVCRETDCANRGCQD
jgi:hypothetical protein